MGEELLRNTMLHDLRGNATALLGWQSLIEPSTQKAASGIERSVEALVSTIQLFSRSVAVAECQEADVHAIASSLGIAVSGTERALWVCPRRLEAALALSEPDSITVSERTDGRIQLQILGLDTKGLALLAVPHSAKIVEAVDSPSRALGVCLFKEVVRGVRGEYEISGDRTELGLILSLAAESGE